MNNILQLKSKFSQGKGSGRPGLANLPKNGKVDVTHILKLEN